MLVNRSIAVFLAMALFAAPIWPQGPAVKSPAGPAATGPLKTSVSPVASSVAGRFIEIARELVQSKTITGPQADQAILLLTAARSLDGTATGIEPLMLRAAIRNEQRDYTDHILLCLQSYVGPSADRVLIMEAVQRLVSRLSSVDQRKEMLETLVKGIGNRNPAIDSELAILLGQLMLEKGDKEAAKFYMLQAYTNNKYNRTAFAKLAELAPNDIGPAIYLEHLRLIVQENPLDINAAVAFSQYAERLGLYDLASQSYLYCAQLFQYLYPSEPLPPHIYLPWAIACYNSRQNQQVCIQIAQTIRNGGQFDLFLEAIAGKAAIKAGDHAKAKEIFTQAEQRASQVLKTTPAQLKPNQQSEGFPSVKLNAKQIAWYYCFARKDPAQAVAWANQAYSTEPNSPSAGGLLAYALTMNSDMKSAKAFLAAFERTQIADIAQARVQVAEGDRVGAVKTLRTAVAKDAGSLAAETARDLLRELGSEYVSPVDTTAITTYLTQSLGQTVTPRFFAPDKMLDIQFIVLGKDYSYGADLDGLITITNKGADPLVISPEGLFRGGIQIAAQISGSLAREIPNLFSQTIRMELIVASGKSITHTVRLSTGELRRLLASHPQASLDIQFTLYLDPASQAGGPVTNRLIDLKPVTVAIKRPAAEITAEDVRGRFNLISSGQQGQKIQTARLFTGLLREQQIMAEEGRTLYPYRYKPWLTELLRSSLTSVSGLLLSPNADDWIVKVHTMADLLSVPLDAELATAAAKNLNHDQWPVRLMAVYLLANNHGDNFRPVLDWIAKQDASELVRSLAASLQSAPASVLSAVSPADELATIRP
ncbi:MAG TPA: hypothetical protein VLI39_10105 [Sedimentisphaerales bacterium]|nr:hypothetical protein [Sedimentisphaerales bacterium]